SPRSDVVVPPYARQNRILVTCGTPGTSNMVLNSGSPGGTSSIGYSGRGNAFASSLVHCSQAASPQKSSTQTKPPFSRYCLRRTASASESSIVPTSDAITYGQ